MIERLDADYLIIGTGAMSMAFADVILAHDESARIVMVDKRPAPGGHWTDAYPFVRLHQPALFYGLHSTCLGSGGADLASGPEIVAYFDRAMQRFVATGRVRFLPMCEYRGEGQVVSLIDPEQSYEVTAHRRVVDGSYLEASVPSMRPPAFDVASDVELCPPNRLPRIRSAHDEYVIVGAGKTGIDAVLFLLENAVPPDRITWITPNDSWLWDRATVPAGGALSTFRVMLERVLKEQDPQAAFLQLERDGIVLRLDPRRLPTKWRCATIERSEAEQLRRVQNVVRLGRVRKVHEGRVELDNGEIDIATDALIVDCSANGLTSRPVRPIFAEGAVTLQSVLMCQQTFSAALLARLELVSMSDTRRNALLKPVPHPEAAEDIATTLPLSIRNMLSVTRVLPRWLRGSRLYLGHHEPLPTYVAEAARMGVALARSRPVTAGA